MKNLLGIPIPALVKEIHPGVNVSAMITLKNMLISVISIKDGNGNYYYKDIDFTATINTNSLTAVTDLTGKSLIITYLC